MNQTSHANQSIFNAPPSAQRTQALAEINDILLYVSVAQQLVQLTSCSYFSALLAALITEMCGDLITGLKDIAGTAAAIGILLIPATWLFMAMFNQLLIDGHAPPVMMRGAKISVVSANPDYNMEVGPGPSMTGGNGNVNAGATEMHDTQG